MNRKQQRELLLAERTELTVVQRQQYTDAILASIKLLLKQQPVGVLAFYWPIKGEIDCRDMAKELMLAGWQLALPVIDESSRQLRFAHWTPETKMKKGVWNIPVPISPQWLQPDIYLIPLVGFDDNGYRLGYGGGYYDRTLAAVNAPIKCVGIGLESARLTTFAAQDYDIPMDAIITEAAVYHHGPAVLKHA